MNARSSVGEALAAAVLRASRKSVPSTRAAPGAPARNHNTRLPSDPILTDRRIRATNALGALVTTGVPRRVTPPRAPCVSAKAESGGTCLDSDAYRHGVVSAQC